MYYQLTCFKGDVYACETAEKIILALKMTVEIPITQSSLIRQGDLYLIFFSITIIIVVPIYFSVKT